MSFQNAQSITLMTAAAVSRLRFVTQGASGVAHVAAGGDADGVALQAATAANTAISVAQLDGAIIEIEASAAIAVGALIGSAANGQARTAVSGDAILGKAISAASAAGEIVSFIGRRGSALVP